MREPALTTIGSIARDRDARAARRDLAFTAHGDGPRDPVCMRGVLHAHAARWQHDRRVRPRARRLHAFARSLHETRSPRR
jgi:hypothetical protein